MMFSYMMKQWKCKKVTVALIVLGFFIGSLVLSIGTSVTIENYNYVMDQTSGRADTQLEIELENKDSVEWNTLEDSMDELSSYGELQILSPQKVAVGPENRQCQIVPVFLKKSSTWHVPILHGRYLKQSDWNVAHKEVVIGKTIAKELGVEVGDTIKVDNENCLIIGVCGRKIRGTIWDTVIYVTYADIRTKSKDYYENFHSIFMLLKNGKDEFMNDSKKIIEDLHTKGINLYFNELSAKTSYSSVINSVVITVISAGIIFIVSITNITNLMIYWIMERRKEFAITKAIGGNDAYIGKYVVKEVVLMAFLGAILAVLVQGLLVLFLGSIMLENSIYLEVTIVNCIVAVCVATVCGVVAAIIPAKMALRIQPSEILACE